MKGTICHCCKYIAYRCVTKPPLNFGSWGCLKRKVRFGSNKAADQVDFPKKCSHRVEI